MEVPDPWNFASRRAEPPDTGAPCKLLEFAFPRVGKVSRVRAGSNQIEILKSTASFAHSSHPGRWRVSAIQRCAAFPSSPAAKGSRRTGKSRLPELMTATCQASDDETERRGQRRVTGLPGCSAGRRAFAHPAGAQIRPAMWRPVVRLTYLVRYFTEQ